VLCPVQLKQLLNPVDGLFLFGASQAGMVIKNPSAKRGGTCSIFCGYPRILS